jgi:hypothetical protein
MTTVSYIIESTSEVEGIRIIPVVRKSVSYHYNKSGMYYSAFKYPVAVLFISGKVTRLVKISGEEIDIKTFKSDFPGAEIIIADYVK